MCYAKYISHREVSRKNMQLIFNLTLIYICTVPLLMYTLTLIVSKRIVMHTEAGIF